MNFGIFFMAIAFLVEFSDADFDAVRIAFYHGETAQQYELLSITSLDELSSFEAFNNSLKTVLYIHGFRESLASESVETVVNAFIKRKSHNILVLNWSVYANGSYVTDAVPNLIQIGKLMGRCVFSLLKQKIVKLNQLHIVGHSLGGQMSGYIGRWIMALSRNSMKLKRITALDPAKPLFYHSFFFLPTIALSFFDAEMVDVIHTDAGILGANIPTGSVDFWPNGGVLQPGCTLEIDPLCAHARSWHYFAESVASHDQKFYSIKCNDYDEFKNMKCIDDTPLNNMGIDAAVNSYGNYYLQTNSKYRFDRGIVGSRFSMNDFDRKLAGVK